MSQPVQQCEINFGFGEPCAARENPVLLHTKQRFDLEFPLSQILSTVIATWNLKTRLPYFCIFFSMQLRLKYIVTQLSRAYIWFTSNSFECWTTSLGAWVKLEGLSSAARFQTWAYHMQSSSPIFSVLQLLCLTIQGLLLMLREL